MVSIDCDCYAIALHRMHLDTVNGNAISLSKHCLNPFFCERVFNKADKLGIDLSSNCPQRLDVEFPLKNSILNCDPDRFLGQRLQRIIGMCCKDALNFFRSAASIKYSTILTVAIGCSPFSISSIRTNACSFASSISDTIRMMLDSPAPKWNSEYPVPSFVFPVSSATLPDLSILSFLYPLISFPRIRDTALCTAFVRSSTCVSGTEKLLDAQRSSSFRSLAGTVLDTPKSKTSLSMGYLFQRKFLKFAVRRKESLLVMFLSINSYSMDQSCMLSSYFPLFAKKRPGLISLYAHPAAPRMVVFPPPFGPISAVTGKSKDTGSLEKPRMRFKITFARYCPYFLPLAFSRSALIVLSRISLLNI